MEAFSFIKQRFSSHHLDGLGLENENVDSSRQLDTSETSKTGETMESQKNNENNVKQAGNRVGQIVSKMKDNDRICV